MPYCGVLAILKASARNCILHLSVKGICLNSEKSTFRVGGARLLCRPRLPPVNGAGGATALVSNHRSGLRPPLGAALGFLPATASGRQLDPPPQTPWQPLERSVKAPPVRKAKMPLTFQLPTMELATAFIFAPPA